MGNDYDGKSEYNSTDVYADGEIIDLDGTFAEVQYRINITPVNGVLYLPNKKYTANENDKTINVNKNITINGQGAILDGDNRLGIMNISDNVAVTIINITFINGNKTHTNGGGAIYSRGNLTIDSCHFKNTVAIGKDTHGFDICGGAIYIGLGDLFVTDSTFTNTTAAADGGAIGANYMYAVVTVLNSIFTNTTAANTGDGGAILAHTLYVSNSNFTNTTACWGGAISGGNTGGATVIGSNFINTKAVGEGNSYGGAISGQKLNISYSNFINNTVKTTNPTYSELGLAIYVWNDLNLSNCRFIENNSTGSNIIYIDDSDVYLNNNTIITNILPIENWGSEEWSMPFAVFKSPTSLKFDNVTVEDGDEAILTAIFTDDNNNIIGSNANITAKIGDTNVTLEFNYTTMKFTGKFDQRLAKGNYTITGSTYKYATDCTVTNGTLTVTDHIPDFNDLQAIVDAVAPNSVIYLNGTNYIAKPGQSVVRINKTITIYGCSQDDPSLMATLDAQGHCNIFECTVDLTLNVSNIEFINGYSSGDGGAIDLRGNLTVNNCIFTNNSLELSDSFGGAIGGDHDRVTVINSTFKNNHGNVGGAIGLEDGSVIVINSTFIENTAEYNGGAIYGSRNCYVYNSKFIDNTAMMVGSIMAVNLTVSNSNFTNNSAPYMYPEIYCNNLNLSNSRFVDMNATGKEIVYVTKGNVTLNNNTITTNGIPIFNSNRESKFAVFTSPIYLKFENVKALIGENATLTAVLTDDNGNIIGSNANITGKVNNTDVIFVFNNETKKFTANYPQTQTEGQYTITGNYTNATNCIVTDGILKVSNRGPVDEFKVDIASKVYGNFSGNITILPADATGNVTIKVNGTTYAQVEVVNGKADWLLTNLTPGNYNVTFEYSGDDNYEPATNSTIVDITKASINPADINVTVTDPIYGQVVVEVDLPNNVTGNVTLNVIDQGKTFNANISNSKAIFQLGNQITVGNHNITVTYNGNEYYVAASKNDTITVNKITTSVVLENVTVTAEKTNVIINGNTTGFEDGQIQVQIPGSGGSWTTIPATIFNNTIQFSMATGG